MQTLIVSLVSKWMGLTAKKENVFLGHITYCIFDNIYLFCFKII